MAKNSYDDKNDYKDCSQNKDGASQNSYNENKNKTDSRETDSMDKKTGSAKTDKYRDRN